MHSDPKRKISLSTDNGNLPLETTQSSRLPINRIESIEGLKACLSGAKAFRIKYNRPFITISYAQSVDGSIAFKNRQPIHLSGPESSVLTHQIRASCDAILIGIGTLLADDPRLTVRLTEGNNPQPLILDTRLRTPLNARLVKRSDLSPWTINAKVNPGNRTLALKKAGAAPLPCDTAQDGKIDLYALWPYWPKCTSTASW
jgi:hypothetical protein